MKNGHIRLGNPGDLRDYLLVEPKQYQKAPANQMAAKLGGGAGSYDDLAAWQGWLQNNWQAGVGKKEIEDGGFLYAELETRFKGQLCLPLRMDIEWTGHTAGSYTKNESWPTGIDDFLELTPSGSVQKIAAKFTNSNTGYDNSTATFILRTGPASAILGIKIYTDTGGDPESGVEVDSATCNGTSDFAINGDLDTAFTISATLTAGASYWIIARCASGTNVILPVYDNGSAAATRKIYNGATWSNTAYSFFWHIVTSSSIGAGNGARQARIYNDQPHFITRSTQWGVANALYKYASSTVSRVTALSAAPTAMLEFGGSLYIAYSGSRGIDGWNGTVISNQAGVYAEFFAAWNGYLWRAYENDVYYTTDGTTWTGPVQVGPDGYTVTGMAGLDRDMYVATTEALYKVGEFDQVFGVCRWNNIHTSNGVKMTHHQGAIYIPTHSDLLRFGGSEFMSVTPLKDEGLPEYKQGKVLALVSHNYWLFAVVAPYSSSTQAIKSWPVILAWNDQGWHYIGKLPRAEASHGTPNVSSLSWDVANNYLWVTGEQAIYRFTLPIDHQNPYKDNSTNVRFWPVGHLETPWFYGGLKELQKDCESVYIAGENISSSRPVRVYWQDDDSTDWELLGTVTSNREELRWSDYDTRPNTKQIKLGFVMYTDDYTESPRIDAIRLKYMTMVHDRFRWQLPIMVSDEQQMLDGDLNIHTAAQMRAHIDEMVNSVPPVIFEDMDGTQYEIKILSAVENVQEYRYEDSAHKIVWVYNIGLEQVSAGTYSG